MKKLLLFILILLIPFMINAEELKLNWQKSWGGNRDETFSKILKTPDGGFIVYGYSESTDIEGLPNKGWKDAIILKYDKDGNLLWQNSWGGNSDDVFEGVFQTEDGGIIGYGYSRSTDIEGLPNKGEDDAIIVKYDKDGNLMWQKSLGGTDFDSFHSVSLTEDGRFITAGGCSTDIDGITSIGGCDGIIVKYDKDGNMIWQRNWGGNDYDEFRNILQTQDDGFIVYGFSYSTDIEGLPNKGEDDAIIVKYDKDGNMLWQKSWGGNSYDDFYDILQTQDGGFIVYGVSLSTDIEGLPNKGRSDAIIVKYDKDGNVLWQKSWGGNDYDDIYGIFQTLDGGFIAYGYTDSNDIEGLPIKDWYDSIILKYDKDGNLMWQKSCGGNDFEFLYKLFRTEDGGFIASGYTVSNGLGGILDVKEYDSIILKYDKDGNLMWQKSWGGNDFDEFRNIFQTEDGGFIVSGSSSSTDIEGMPNKGSLEEIIVKYSIEYELEYITTENGVFTAEQQGKYGIITSTPNEGYEVETIIIKDKNGEVLDLEVTKLEDGTYSFDLYTDVSVEVTFKEKVENPKTGIIDIITILFVGAVVSLGGFVLVKRYNERYEI